MNDSDFNFFQNHSRTFLEMAFKTDRQERMEHTDGYGKRTGVCGDTVEIFLKICDKKVQAVSFLVDGCINTNACCNAVVLLIEGKRVEDAWEIRPEAVVDFLETLPSSHEHCAELSVGALYLALSNFQERKRAPWKQLYEGV